MSSLFYVAKRELEAADVAVAYSGISERFMQGKGSPY